MNTTLSRGQRLWLIGVLSFAWLVRLFTLGLYPLFDNTEARYAEIARKMVETNNWVTPQYDYGVPFWGKPPLSTWASALTMKIFGVNEFGARVSSFLFAAGICWLVYLLAAPRQGRDYALVTAFVLSTSLLFFIVGGSVMTDASLGFGIILSMVSFWLALEDNKAGGRGLWGYLFFTGLGIGLLSKGPVAAVLTFFPTGLWVLWKKKWAAAWHGLPWVTGAMLALAIALPWYLAAERATPGFLNYFLVGENFRRFTEKGWHGDLYGTAHSRPHGMIWLYWLLATLPWCPVFLAWLWRRVKSVRLREVGDWPAYLVLWAVTPMVFFTFAGNILWTYIFTGLPAFAILMAEMLGPALDKSRGKKPLLSVAAGLFVPLAFLALVLISPPQLTKNSQKGVVRGYLAARPGGASQLVYLFKAPPYSAEFYTSGKVRWARDAREAETFLHTGTPNFFVVKKSSEKDMPDGLRSRLVKAGDYGDYELMGQAAR